MGRKVALLGYPENEAAVIRLQFRGHDVTMADRMALGEQAVDIIVLNGLKGGLTTDELVGLIDRQVRELIETTSAVVVIHLGHGSAAIARCCELAEANPRLGVLENYPRLDEFENLYRAIWYGNVKAAELCLAAQTGMVKGQPVASAS
jgi:hypothetical protein